MFCVADFRIKYSDLLKVRYNEFRSKYGLHTSSNFLNEPGLFSTTFGNSLITPGAACLINISKGQDRTRMG